MALNLWKAAGKPTAYNPLGNSVSVGFLTLLDVTKEYVVRFKAKYLNGTSGQVRISGRTAVYNDFVLSGVLKEYETSFSVGLFIGVKDERFYIWDNLNSNNVYITDIELVEKPLPKLTVNGIDGFASGKWTLHANAKVIDDETLELNATANYQQSYIDVLVTPNTQYAVSISPLTNGMRLAGQWRGGTTGLTWTPELRDSGNLITLTSPSNANTLRIFLDNVVPSGKFTFKRPMLNLGSVPVPYEKKRGDKMVEPVPKKNLFDGKWDSGYISGGSTSTALSAHATARTTKWIPCKPNTTYTLSGGNRNSWQVKSSSGVISSLTELPTVTTRSDSAEMRVYYSVDGAQTQVQIEQGTTATPYEPYTLQMNKRPAKPVAKQEGGLRMDGVNNYLHLPPMTMDAIEIDCFIDSVQLKPINTIVDARYGLSNGYLQITGGAFYPSGWGYANGYKFGERSVITLKASTPFTDDVTVFNNMFNSQQTKGILYAVRCYLNGAKVYELDFTNPNSIVGDKALPNAKNLIPSFEDSRWQLHANARVYGRDVLRLEATAIWQSSYIELNVKHNTNYIIQSSGNGNYAVTDEAGSTLLSYRTGQSTVNSGTKDKLRVYLSSATLGVGTFDFIKPQLYELSGSEGTVYGAPIRQVKPSKRVLYAKR